MLNEKEVKLLLTWANMAQKILDTAEEMEICELKRRDQIAILHALKETQIKRNEVKDEEGTCINFTVDAGDMRIAVRFYSGANLRDDFEKRIYDCRIEISSRYFDEECAINDFINILEKMLHEETTIINLTPSAVTFYAQDGKTILNTIPSSGVARAEQTRESLGDINGIPVCKTIYGRVEGLPSPQENTIYIVPVLTAQAASGRDDLFIVDDLVRDPSGKILGYKSLARI